ncbi:MAG: DNA-binding protein, partial [Paludibacter sp.]|nr:DNA-binding protein [Paludibacter sp.]
IQPSGKNYQSQRFTIESSDDGVNFRKITQLEPPRQGWQNDDFAMTHAVKPTTARYFRFLYDLKGTEVGYEDMDVAKWKQSLKIRYILLSSEPKIHQYEGKNGSVWRVSPHTSNEQIPAKDCIDTTKMLNITHLVKDGKLTWKAPKGAWTILRIGHTSTGHINATGGGGRGLECDKFNADAIRLQFNSWFGRAYETAGADLAQRVLKVFHIDSWECGSQNWTSAFNEEFRKRRGYEIVNYLPVMAGVPLQNAKFSEKILSDVRQTIAELVVDVFYKTLTDEAHAKGCQVNAESIAPTFVSDGMLHYKYVDLTMGEFWLQSPTHDKPNDVLDAVSGAHIYRKNIVQAEAFTQIRSTFTEYPEMLKTLQDRNYAQGINRLSFHVDVLNPLNKKPGMTLDGIGLYFQRDQTWWRQAKTWIDYTTRCQALLQWGEPVADLAVFVGDETPRRSVLPDRLIPFLPGIFGAERVESERVRLANEGVPTEQVSVGVTFQKNTYRAENWLNPLRGYAYDCVNPDVLTAAKVENGDLILPSGARYKALLILGKYLMQPNPEAMSRQTKTAIKKLKLKGVREIETPFTQDDFSSLGFERDFIVTENGSYAQEIVYNHRTNGKADIYFVSNQQDKKRFVEISLRVQDKIPEIWNAVDGSVRRAENWKIEDGRTHLPLALDAGESLFIVLRQETIYAASQGKNWTDYETVTDVSNAWKVKFDAAERGKRQEIAMDTLMLWNNFADDSVKYFSGTATYYNSFVYNQNEIKDIFIELDKIYNIATVKINGVDCGTIWTKPYIVDISRALKRGKNTVEIAVTNTWANRILGDEVYSVEPNPDNKIWTNARYRMNSKQPVNSGLEEKIRIVVKK